MKPPFEHESELRALLAAIVDSSDDAIVSKTLDGIITSWNRAAERIFGYTAEEAVGRHITLIIPPERHAEEDAVLARLRRGEKIDHFETVRVSKDGRQLIISLTVSPIKDASGRVIGASKVARDMTNERRLDESRARLAAIVESSDDAVVGKTLAGVVTSWNRAAERIFGYTAAEAIGRHITFIIPPERHAEEDDVLARIARGEKVEHFDTVRVARDGRLIDVSLTVSPIRDYAGRIVGASKVARDITERKEAERERAALLARERQARAEAEALNRSKDEFLATLSHELRTPLNAIFGWARMLEAGRLDAADAKRATDAIVRNAQAQVRLIEDLLDVSRIITGNMRLEVGPVDVRTVIEAALDAVRPAASAKDIALDTMLDPRVGPIMGAPDRLQQVVWNLVMNAVKFTPRGGRVHVILEREVGHVRIVVSDTGEGIRPDLLPHVFDRFRQGDSSPTRPHGGLGIGLALVRHLVELHGGAVKAESPGPGMGATFTVTLPVALPQPEPRPSQARRDSVDAKLSDAKPASLRTLRVLVVDDDPDALDLLNTILTNCGAEVRTAASAAAAREMLLGWKTDVLVCDIEMPDEDGVTFLRTARAMYSARGERIPAIALTAYGASRDRIRLLEAGFNLHLAKPVDPAELSIAVASVAGLTG